MSNRFYAAALLVAASLSCATAVAQTVIDPWPTPSVRTYPNYEAMVLDTANVRDVDFLEVEDGGVYTKSASGVYPVAQGRWTTTAVTDVEQLTNPGLWIPSPTAKNTPDESKAWVVRVEVEPGNRIVQYFSARSGGAQYVKIYVEGTGWLGPFEQASSVTVARLDSLVDVVDAFAVTDVPTAPGTFQWRLSEDPANDIYAMNGQTIPNGASIYPDLAALEPAWVSGVDIVLPDWSGQFLRNVGGNAGSLGVVQADDIASHNHSASRVRATGGEVPASPGGNYYSANGPTTGSLIQGPTSSVGGAETRPTNVALVLCVIAKAVSNATTAPDPATTVFAAEIDPTTVTVSGATATVTVTNATYTEIGGVGTLVMYIGTYEEDAPVSLELPDVIAGAPNYNAGSTVLAIQATRNQVTVVNAIGALKTGDKTIVVDRDDNIDNNSPITITATLSL